MDDVANLGRRHLESSLPYRAGTVGALPRVGESCLSVGISIGEWTPGRLDLGQDRRKMFEDKDFTYYVKSLLLGEHFSLILRT
jgi:hypothetical protein